MAVNFQFILIILIMAAFQKLNHLWKFSEKICISWEKEKHTFCSGKSIFITPLANQLVRFMNKIWEEWKYQSHCIFMKSNRNENISPIAFYEKQWNMANLMHQSLNTKSRKRLLHPWNTFSIHTCTCIIEVIIIKLFTEVMHYFFLH